jgi:alpha-tubulin suppressor-like RCC1 family protein
VSVGGEAYAWGDNSYGQLGDGTITNRLSPVVSSAISNVASAIAGYNHTVVLTNGGEVYSWGANSYGQIGNGSTAVAYDPQHVTGLSAITKIAAYNHNLALSETGEIYAWGYNSGG